MRKRPPTVRACSIRARKLAKSGKGDTKKGEALAACAATSRRSRPRPKVAPATKSTCRRRAKALQSGKVGRSTPSKVAWRLGLCRKPAKKGGAHRANPSRLPKWRYLAEAPRGARFVWYEVYSDGEVNLRSEFHRGGPGPYYWNEEKALDAAREWLEDHHDELAGVILAAQTDEDDIPVAALGKVSKQSIRDAAWNIRGNPSAPSVKAKVVGSKTMGKVYRRRFLLVQFGPSRLVWVEASPSSTIGPIVNRASADAIGVDTDDRGYPLSEEDRWAIVAAFNAYVARRGSAW